MSQHDMNIANQGFPAFRTDLNNALVALASLSSGLQRLPRPRSTSCGSIPLPAPWC